MQTSTTLTFVVERLDTPLGEMLLATDERSRLRAFDWTEREGGLARALGRQSGCEVRLVAGRVERRVRDAIGSYFEGELHALEGLPVVTGGTPFQREVWSALRRIPVGETISYGELAKRVGRPKAVRAVGLANRMNPIGVVVPCHRVIGKDRSLIGYAGGLDRKRWLLAHERAVVS